MTARKIRILVVDDSAIVRKLLTEALSAEADMEVVGTAPDPFVARDKILALSPDVLTLDIEMPRMDGVTFLKRLMHFRPMPVIVISSLGTSSSQASIEALAAGAVDVLAKPGGPQSVGELGQHLAAKVRAAAAARVQRPLAPASPVAPVASAYPASSLIAIGASTGGTEAIHQVLMGMPANGPGIVIAQHIPPVFSRVFAERLNAACPMRVREACDGDAVEPGLALVAPGNFHLLVRRAANGYRVEVKDGPLVCYQRPAVDVLFRSVAQAAGAHAVGAILTGMGSDGAQGLLAMQQAGARTIAQDEATCVVFGMPREAIKLGGVHRVLPLGAISAALLSEARR
ncbi:MAG: chemotaxis response regulator protein-glutamate methylesterase [Bryobacteraceae bacterium]|nr:chemotaxis response regulator protein-glutamate methylesterase [Bryobacteraceae bacterium]